MPNTRATEGASEAAFALPPRQPTFLVHYSRRSKIATAALLFTAFISLIVLLSELFAPGIAPDVAKHHKPKIHGLDNKDRTSSPASGGGNTSSADGNSGSAEALNQQDDHTVLMVPAPDPELTESTTQGDLPRISEDGREPWQVYARPFNGADKRPRLAVLVADLGLSRLITDAAVTRLPANVTLAFDVQSQAIGAWCARARQEGHEILLSVPMEPFDFPRSDPGPHTLLTTASNSANLEKLNWAMRQGVGYIGITTLSGSRFTTDSGKLKQVMQTLHDRGLMILDAHAAPHSAVGDLAQSLHVPAATVNARIDENLSPEAIDTALQQLEQVARLNGSALAVVAPVPVVIDRLQTWLKTLPQRGIALAPVSAVVQ